MFVFGCHWYIFFKQIITAFIIIKLENYIYISIVNFTSNDKTDVSTKRCSCHNCYTIILLKRNVN